MNKKIKITIIITFLFFVGFFLVYRFSPLFKIRECPDEKIVNEMPGSPSSTYFIKNGERKEISAYDIPWVERYCKVTVTVTS